MIPVSGPRARRFAIPGQPDLPNGTTRKTRRTRRPRPNQRSRGVNQGGNWGRLLAMVSILLVTSAAFVATFRSIPTRTGLVVSQIRSGLTRESPTIPTTGPLDDGLPQTSIIMARDNSVLAEINDVRFGRRVSVPLSALPSDLALATVAAEDRRFFNHDGVDPVGFIRAFTQNANTGSVASGASTLEMQLVRNLFLPDERAEQTISRKIREAMAARKLDERATKSEVLETYLNSVYYGNGSYGAEAAAQGYFAKPAKLLTLPEAAMIAGLPQSPIAYNPLLHYDQAKKRQEKVLDLMLQAEFISPEQASSAISARIELHEPDPAPTRFPHWDNYITDLVRTRYGPDALYSRGLRIHTTIDPEMQSLAENIVQNNDEVRAAAHANNSAMVIIDPATSQILAMVGSKNFNDDSIAGQVNVSLSMRQPGSAIKPIVFLAGFEKGLDPAVEVWDRLTQFAAPAPQPPYQPTNFDDHFYGQVSLRDALGNSLNVPAVKVLKYAGVPAVQDLSRRLGITTLEDWNRQWLSLTLGGGDVQLVELTGAYAAISRMGQYKPLEPLLAVETSRGEVLYSGADSRGAKQVVDPRLAYQLVNVMGDAGARQVTFGPQSPLNLPRPHMMKTGTTDDYRDTWTIGCLPQICVGVWMGNTNNEPMVKVSSSLTAGKLWVDMMQTLIQRYNYQPVPFPKPDGVVIRRVPNTGASRPGSTEHDEVFLQERQELRFLEMDWMSPN